MEFGLGRGLAVSGAWDQKINALRYNEQLDQRAAQEAEARTKLFSEAYGHEPTGSVYDDPIIKDYTKKRMMDAVQVTKNNPNWKYDPNALAELKAIKGDIKGNEHVLRAVAYIEAKKKLNADLAEVARNPNAHDQEAYQQRLQEFKNYDQYGHQGGLEAAQKEGPKALVYTKPMDLIEDVPTALAKLGGTIKDYDIVQTGDGGGYTQPKSGTIETLKQAAYSGQMGRSIQIKAKQLGLTPAQTDKWVTDNIALGFDKWHKLGDPFAIRRLALQEAEYGLHKAKFDAEKQQSSPYTTWDDLMNPKKVSQPISPKVFNEVWGPNMKITVMGTGGRKADLTGFEFKSDGTVYKPQSGQYKGIPHATGYIDIPIENAKDMGLVKGKNLFFKENDPDEWEAGPGFDSKRISVKRHVDKDGESHLYARVLHEVPLDPMDQTARSMYQMSTTPTKLVQPVSNPFKSVPAGAQSDDAGNVFLNGQYIGHQDEFQ